MSDFTDEQAHAFYLTTRRESSATAKLHYERTGLAYRDLSDEGKEAWEVEQGRAVVEALRGQGWTIKPPEARFYVETDFFGRWLVVDRKFVSEWVAAFDGPDGFRHAEEHAARLNAEGEA